MKIHIASALGSGPTKLAAFDAALIHTGIANYNLIRLSSVIPPKSKLTLHDGPIPKTPGKWGDRLYVVMADHRIETPNVEAWAGIGWVQDKKTGQGLFVEHEGFSENSVRRDIEESLKTLMKNRGIDYGEIEMTVVGDVCVNEPICALAVAVYQASDWKNRPHLIR